MTLGCLATDIILSAYEYIHKISAWLSDFDCFERWVLLLRGFEDLLFSFRYVAYCIRIPDKIYWSSEEEKSRGFKRTETTSIRKIKTFVSYCVGIFNITITWSTHLIIYYENNNSSIEIIHTFIELQFENDD